MSCDYRMPDKTCTKFPMLGVIHDEIFCDDICRGGEGFSIPEGLDFPRISKCKHMEKGERKTETCICFWIICHNEKCPIFNKPYIWDTRKCSPRRCKFFETDEC